MDERAKERSNTQKDNANKRCIPARRLFYPDEALAAAVEKRKLLLKRLPEDRQQFTKEDDDSN